MKIARLVAREVFDSRGNPTVACDLFLEDGVCVTASVPSGSSRSVFEAIELRDGDYRLGGQGVLKALENIENHITPLVVGQEPDVIATDVRMLELDGTDNKAKLGANATLAVSIAVCKAQALINGLEPYELVAHLCELESVSLPFPMFNLINGGVHAHNGLAIQEFMVMPVGAQSFRESFECAVMIFHSLSSVLEKEGKLIAFGDEGGYASRFKDEREVLECLKEAVEHAQVTSDMDVVLALDIAASQLYDPKRKKYAWKGGYIDSQELIEQYVALCQEYPIYSIEDGLHEMDVEGWQLLMDTLGDSIQIVGDDLFATNPNRIIEGARQDLANAVIIKPNQIGTVTETLQAIRVAKQEEMSVIASHRSGETEDSFIVDLAIGASVGQIKAGSTCRGERMAKYNRMLQIEDELMRSMLGA